MTNIKPEIGLEPLRLGLDFNIGNMNCVIGIIQNQKLLIFDEISGSHDTDSIAQEIKARYPMNKIYIYPDASGGNRSTNASQTDIQILKDMGSAIKAHAATRQSETGFLPYRLYYVTAKGKAVYKSMPVAES